MPFAGGVTIVTVAALIPTSSVSLEITLTVTGEPSVVTAESFTAVGGRFPPPPKNANLTASALVLDGPGWEVMVTV